MSTIPGQITRQLYVLKEYSGSLTIAQIKDNFGVDIYPLDPIYSDCTSDIQLQVGMFISVVGSPDNVENICEILF